MSWEYIILFGLLAIYAVTLLIMAYGYTRSPREEADEETAPIPLTIIICARNEEKTLPRCIKTILEQEYDMSKVQVLVINDASSDNTAAYATAMLQKSGVNHKVISNSEKKGKKKSITYAMQFAAHEHIVIRDADTFTLSYTWLRSLAYTIARNKADMIIAPVAMADNQGSIWAMQAIENNVLQVLSCGSAALHFPFLCNGANLVFTRSLFEKCGGYQKHIDTPSGDDVLLLEDAKKIPGVKIHYLKSREAVVRTYPCFSLAELIRQRIRWASKYNVNPNKFNLYLASLTFVINFAVLFCLFNGFLMPQNALLGLIFVGVKLLCDILLLFLASGFLKNRALAWYILPIGLVYPIYACIIAICTVFIKPKWK